jgi:hypothetical protein
MIKFNKYHVTDGKVKARCHYSIDRRMDNRKCVTIYAKDYTDSLGKIFAAEYQNDTEIRSDYFDKGKVVLFEGHVLYNMARARVTSF